MLRRNAGRLPSYGSPKPGYQTCGRSCRRMACSLVCALALTASLPVAAKTLQVVAFGDSLMAGYNLPAGDDFPARLQTALHQDGIDVAITNASVSGDTTSGGLDRIDWSVPDGTDGVLLELGANDMLRGQDPSLTKQNLDAMIGKLQARHIAVYLLGMKANPTLGADYVSRFDAIYPALAKADSLPLEPFFLDGVAGQGKLQLADGMHPNPDGVAVMVARMKPGVEVWLKSLPGAKD